MNDDDAQLLALGRELAEAVRAALPSWVERCVRTRCAEAGVVVDDVTSAASRRAGAACARQVGADLERLLSTDPDEQAGTPLTLLRAAVSYPTAVLNGAGVPPVDRDDFARRAFPADHYDLTPASFADVDPSLQAPGIAWGAARAYVHRRRHDADD